MATVNVDVPAGFCDDLDMLAKSKGLSRNELALFFLEASVAHWTGLLREQERPTETLEVDVPAELSGTLALMHRNLGDPPDATIRHILVPIVSSIAAGYGDPARLADLERSGKQQASRQIDEAWDRRVRNRAERRSANRQGRA